MSDPFELFSRGMTRSSTTSGNVYSEAVFNNAIERAASTFKDMAHGSKNREENEYLKALILTLVPETFKDPSPPTVPEFLKVHLDTLSKVKAHNVSPNLKEVARILSEDELVLNQFWDLMYGAVFSVVDNKIKDIGESQRSKNNKLKVISNMHRNKQ